MAKKFDGKIPDSPHYYEAVQYNKTQLLVVWHSQTLY